ncbi:MAG TPA: hypothetical protein VGL65_04740 [Gemmatimonadales bacterium]|jgi:serine/threonine protein kinase
MNTVAELNESLIGRYLVEKEIGQGGMATVYLARDVRHDRKVAIKVLKPELAAVLGSERFVVLRANRLDSRRRIEWLRRAVVGAWRRAATLAPRRPELFYEAPMAQSSARPGPPTRRSNSARRRRCSKRRDGARGSSRISPMAGN